MHLIGQEWASETAPLLADRGPCLVCGHPTGDCTTDFHQEMKKMAEQKASRNAADDTGAAKVAQEQQKETEAQRGGASEPTAGGSEFAPSGRVIKAGEPVTLESADVDTDAFVVVKEDVYQEFYPENSRRPSYRLLFHKGQTVARSAVERADEASRNAANLNA